LKFSAQKCILDDVKSASQKKRIKRKGNDSFEPRKTYVKGESYWQVNLPIEYKIADGKRIKIQKRRTFKDRTEADTAAEQARIQAKNEGTNSFLIPEPLRRDALAAAKKLEPFGATLLEAATFYAKHLEQVRSSEKVETAVQEFLVAREKDELRPRYLKDLRVRLTKFSQSFGERTIAGITVGELNAWLRAFKPFNRNTFRLRLSALFSYAIERKWCQENPVAEVKKVKASAPIGILTPEQFAKVLESASEETLPYWLIGGFAGLRRAEIERLEWKDVRFDLSRYRAFTAALASKDKDAIAKSEKEWRSGALIEVPALKSKTASRRFVQIHDSLADWLEPYIGRTGKICPANLRTMLEIDSCKAGFKPSVLGVKRMKQTAVALDPAMLKGLRPWPKNGLRHSFASYHLAHFGDAAHLALELGHTDQELLFRHYRELVTPEQAGKWWEIQPRKEAKVVSMVA
jgi:integrase